MKKKVLLCCFLPALLTASFVIADEPRINFKIATNSSGDCVAVWEEKVGCDYMVFTQRCDVSGNPLGEKLLVSENGLYSNTHPSVAVNNERGFVVAWSGTNTYGFNWKLYFRLYDQFDNPSEIFQIKDDDNILHNASLSRVAVAPVSGKIVICWIDWENPEVIGDDLTNVNICAQQFRPDGEPISGVYRINEEWLDCGRSISYVLEGATATDEEIAVTYRTRRIDPRSTKSVVSFWEDTKPRVTISYQQGENPGETVFLTISPTTAGKEYQVYYCDLLQENCWLPLREPVKASGTQVTVIDDGGIGSVPLSKVKSRFYKVSLP